MSSLWLITTYFNPLGWRSRRENYHTFRRHLDARLLTVSWSPEGNHEIEEGDADILIRVDGGDLMWQKERLINIGLTHLPDDCDLVGWVDCDILFQDPLWQQQAIDLLSNHEVIQLYGAVEHLKPGSPVDRSFQSIERRSSIIKDWEDCQDHALFLEQELRNRELRTSGLPPQDPQVPSYGFAWAAQRSWLEELGGLPDRAIVGSGDLVCAYALLGCMPDFADQMERLGLGRYCSNHTLNWAKQARASSPQTCHLEGIILHLHHGNLSDRSYIKRQFDLIRTGFQPDDHLELDPGGAWRFNAAAPAETRQMMARYFASRREDGHV
jgi:hypothetical protein